MSTFSGIFPEIPLISADRYDGKNLNSTVFFLSHYHTDHFVGLQTNYKKMFENPLVFLYSSPVTTLILQQNYPCHERCFKSLAFERPTLIKIPKTNKTITVYAFPAGHCPGSIMILFETNEKNILYTGDFRINIDDLVKYKHFHDSRGRVKKIDKMYLDTTFFLKSYPEFPSRDESSQEICKLIREWITLSEDHVVHLQTVVKYGAEFLFMEIFKAFKMPIHTNLEMYNFYKYFPLMDSVMTTDETATRIHCHCMGFHDYCRNDKRLIRVIRPTAMIWTDYVLKDNNLSCTDEELHRVCFSSHASYNEIMGFLKYLQPDEIEANVSGKIEHMFEIKMLVTEYNKKQKLIIEESKKGEAEGDYTSIVGCGKNRFKFL